MVRIVWGGCGYRDLERVCGANDDGGAEERGHGGGRKDFGEQRVRVEGNRLKDLLQRVRGKRRDRRGPGNDGILGAKRHRDA
jgi:hypothetical protein